MRKFGFGSISQITRISSLLVAVAMLTTAGAAYGKTSKAFNGPHGPALWVANTGNFVAEFTPKMLKISGENSPSRVLVSADLDEPWGMIFDSKNNLWVSNVGNGTLTEFTFKQLKALKKNNAPEAAVVISGLDRPEGLAFDGGGNLWVANEGGGGHLVEFTASQLTTSGSPVPKALTDPGEMDSPVGIAFDHSENLWVADDDFSHVLMFTKTQLAAGGSQSATVILTDDGSGSIKDCEPLIFDKSGDLWVGNNRDPVQNLGSVVKFTPGQLAQSGSPTPAVMLTATTVNHTPPSSLDIPAGVAFDGGGNLWVGNEVSDHAGSVAKFGKKLIGSSGSPLPSVFIDSNSMEKNLDVPFFLAFGPEVP